MVGVQGELREALRATLSALQVTPPMSPKLHGLVPTAQPSLAGGGVAVRRASHHSPGAPRSRQPQAAVSIPQTLPVCDCACSGRVSSPRVGVEKVKLWEGTAPGLALMTGEHLVPKPPARVGDAGGCWRTRLPKAKGREWGAVCRG